MARNGYCKTCGKEVRPKYGVPEERPVWMGILLLILFIVTYGIALIIFLLKSFKYCPICGNEVVTFKSKDEVSRYYLKEEENQFRDALELKDDKEVTSSFRKRVQDKVAQYRKLKEKEKHLKDGVELNDKKPSTPREKIIRKAGEANEKEEEDINLPGWYSPGEKERLEMSEEYIFTKNFKCKDCRKKFRSKSRIRQCPFCNSENIRKVSSGWWCELVVTLIILVPLMIFFTLFVGI